jgi:hypothetical protein
MKKIILGIALFLSIQISLAQETFVKKYTSVISEKAGVLSDWQEISLTVVFNEKGTGDIVFYYTGNKSKRFHQISSASEEKTNSGQGYQIIVCVDNEDGNKVAIQLFDDDTALRVLIDKGYFVEFHK